MRGLAKHNLAAIGEICRQFEPRQRYFNVTLFLWERMTAGRFDLCATAQVPQDPNGLSVPSAGAVSFVRDSKCPAPDERRTDAGHTLVNDSRRYYRAPNLATSRRAVWSKQLTLLADGQRGRIPMFF
jgi:hypothetical protein